MAERRTRARVQALQVDAEDGRQRTVLRTFFETQARRWTPRRVAIALASVLLSTVATACLRSVAAPPSVVTLPAGDAAEVAAAMGAHLAARADESCVAARDVGYPYDAIGLRDPGGGPAVRFMAQPRVEERSGGALSAYVSGGDGRRTRARFARCVVVRYISVDYETRVERLCGPDAVCVQASGLV